jgi:pimeloyl-ACP methyl ester carboxylesterase
MAQSLCDLNDCVEAVKKDARFAGFDFSVMGHSWGGFSTLNIAALHPEISRVVVLSGFVSVEILVNSFFGGIMKGYRKPIMALERASNPRFSEFNAVESLSSSGAKALLIYSDNDMLCRKNPHYDTLAEGLAGKENVKLMLVSGKGHNPNYTKDAVSYLGEYVSAKSKLAKKKKLETEAEKKAFIASWDWGRMTAQDESVWKEIFAWLE